MAAHRYVSKTSGLQMLRQGGGHAWLWERTCNGSKNPNVHWAIYACRLWGLRRCKTDALLKPITLHCVTTLGKSLACKDIPAEAGLSWQRYARLTTQAGNRAGRNGGYTRCQNNAPMQGAAATGTSISRDSAFLSLSCLVHKARVDKLL